MSKDDKELREAVRLLLSEEWADYGVTPWTVPGTSVKGSKSSGSMGVHGNSLYSIFIDPFVNAAKVIGAEAGQVGVRLVSLLRTVLESALEALLPRFQADYDRIAKQQAKLIDRVKERYKPAYEAVDDAWDHPDIQLFAFLHDPTQWLGYKAITAKPEAALSVFDALVDGNNALQLYLRDIRNRMYGAASPGAGVPSARPATEGRRLVESGKALGKVDFQGLEIHIDRPEGFVQKGVNSKGEDWERVYLFDYGFIKGTEGGDGEDLDVFVGPDPDAPEAYLVTQRKADGSFDEYKAFLGFGSEGDAVEAYEDHIPAEFLEDVCAVPVGALKGLLGLDPGVELDEAASAKRKPTPGEQVAKALTSPAFLKAVAALPVVQDMRADAEAIGGRSADALAKAMGPVLRAKDAESLAVASNGAWSVPEGLASLDPKERAAVEGPLVAQAQAAMRAFYASRLEQEVASAVSMGVAEGSPYVRSLRELLRTVK